MAGIMILSVHLLVTLQAASSMLFNSFHYLLFLPVVVALYWLSPKKLRLLLLLVASYYFYMSWLKAYGLLLGGLTIVNFALGIALWKTQNDSLKRLVLIAGLSVNLGCLALFKYTDFIASSVWHSTHFLSTWLQFLPQDTGRCPMLNIILPLGISFFVFEFIHYLTDIYKGGKPIFSPLRFGLFAAFFPSQIAGPIKRYQDFDHQLCQDLKYNPELFHSGLWLILKGMFKKAALGDNLAVLVQAGFDVPHMLSTVDAWLSVTAFALQIYFDFSGYTDIGRGSAMLMGFRLPENFNLPYLAKSLREFWHRWHMSLSSWLRDYLYIPLGGSRASEAKVARNLAITMLLGGLWHGASWHFVIWGGFHGIGLALDRAWGRFTADKPGVNRIRDTIAWKSLAWLLTLLTVLVGWVLFRADNMMQAGTMYTAMFLWRGTSQLDVSVTELLMQSTLPVGLALYSLVTVVLAMSGKSTGLQPTFKIPENHSNLSFWLHPPFVARAAAFIGASLLVLGFASFKSMPFIYFQF